MEIIPELFQNVHVIASHWIHLAMRLAFQLNFPTIGRISNILKIPALYNALLRELSGCS